MGRRSDFALTSEEHNHLVAARIEAKKNRDFELSRRIRAVILLGIHKKTRAEVAEICEAGLTTVFLWLRRYRKLGLDGLRDRYKPRQCWLSEEQRAELRQVVVNGPEQAGYDTGVWTASLIGSVIKECYGVTYSVSGVTRLLHSLDLSVQLPQVQLARADPAAQQRWLSNTYPALRRRARKEGGVVFFSGTKRSSNNPAREPGLGQSSEQAL